MNNSVRHSFNNLLCPIAKVACTLSLLFLASVSFAQNHDENTVQTKGIRISEPVVHKGLAVYFLHSDKRDDREFLTLNDGLKAGLVVVSEKQNEQVSELLIENKSDKPLFLQEGDRVTGGKQDRTIYSSLVIKPKSGLMKIPTFCVEQSRWSEGAKGKQFGGNFNQSYATNSVRSASKLSKNQSEVWRQVGKTKADLQKAIGNKDKTTSLNESLDSKKATASIQPFVNALKDESGKHNDLVGVAFAIDGELREINIYPGNDLVNKVYPRLLETYAFDAIVSEHAKTAAATVAGAAQSKPKSKPKSNTTAPTSAAVQAMMQTVVNKKADRNEAINTDNMLIINKATKATDGQRIFRCQTDYKGKPFHLQWLKFDDSVASATGNQMQRQNYNVQIGNLQNDNLQNDNKKNNEPNSQPQQEERRNKR